MFFYTILARTAAYVKTHMHLNSVHEFIGRQRVEEFSSEFRTPQFNLIGELKLEVNISSIHTISLSLLQIRTSIKYCKNIILTFVVEVVWFIMDRWRENNFSRSITALSTHHISRFTILFCHLQRFPAGAAYI